MLSRKVKVAQSKVIIWLQVLRDSVKNQIANPVHSDLNRTIFTRLNQK